MDGAAVVVDGANGAGVALTLPTCTLSVCSTDASSAETPTVAKVHFPAPSFSILTVALLASVAAIAAAFVERIATGSVGSVDWMWSA